MNSILDCSISNNMGTCGYGGAGATCFSIDKHCSRLIFDDQIICSNGNDFATSQVICKWAGYSTGAPAYYMPNQGSNATTQTFLNVRCTGEEESLDDCEQEASTTCDSGVYAGISCSE